MLQSSRTPFANARHLTLLVACVVLCSGCTVSAGAPVSYRAATETLVTTVDSVDAHYLVAQFLQGDRRQPLFDARIDALLSDESLIHDADRMRAIALNHSPDFATALFRALVSRDQRSSAFVRDWHRSIADPQRPLRRIDFSDIRLVLVPGWRYKSSPGNGADLKRARVVGERLGFEVEFVDTDEDATVEENAAYVAAWLGRQHRIKPTILVSASKGGPEVALALDQLHRAGTSHGVLAWISASGLIGGTPLAARALNWPERWLVSAWLYWFGGTARPVPSMSSTVRVAVLEGLQLPPDVLVVNFVSAPFSGEVGPAARTTYHWLLADGPNDGLALLPHTLVKNAITVIEPGTDHFLEREALDTRFEALVRVTLHRAGAGISASAVP